VLIFIIGLPEHVLKKIHRCTYRALNFWMTFLPAKFLFIQQNFYILHFYILSFTHMTANCLFRPLDDHYTNSLHHFTFWALLHFKTSHAESSMYSLRKIAVCLDSASRPSWSPFERPLKVKVWDLTKLTSCYMCQDRVLFAKKIVPRTRTTTCIWLNLDLFRYWHFLLE